jgi:hypothetical protein
MHTAMEINAHSGAGAAILSIILGATAVASEGPNLIANGGFEDAVFGGCPNDCFTSCGFAIQHWHRPAWFYTEDLFRNTDSPDCVAIGTVPNPAGGAYYVSLQGSVCCQCNNNGRVTQFVTLEPGERYRLQMQVYLDQFDAIKVMCGTQSVTFDGSNTATDTWTSVSWYFMAEPGATSIEISSVGTPSAPECMEAERAFIDNISLRRSSCDADLDGDGDVDGADLSVVLGAWGVPTADPSPADMNVDGIVDGADLAVVLNAWGACPD